MQEGRWSDNKKAMKFIHRAWLQLLLLNATKNEMCNFLIYVLKNMGEILFEEMEGHDKDTLELKRFLLTDISSEFNKYLLEEMERPSNYYWEQERDKETLEYKSLLLKKMSTIMSDSLLEREMSLRKKKTINARHRRAFYSRFLKNN